MSGKGDEKHTTSLENSHQLHQREKRKIIKNVVVIGLAFFFSHSGFDTLVRLQSSLLRQEGMGVINSSLISFFVVIACLFLPKILATKLGHKWVLTLSLVSYPLWIAASGYAVWSTMVPASILVGLSAGVLWSVQGSYTTLIAPRYACLTGNSVNATLRKFFGIHAALFQMNGILGAIISSTILYRGTANITIQDNNTWLETCGANDCPYHNKTNPNLENPPDYIVWTLLGTLLAIASCAPVLVGLFVDPLPKDISSKAKTACKDVAKLFLATTKQYGHKETLLLIPISMYQGIANAFYGAEFNQSYVTCSQGIWMIGYVMLPLGIVSAISSFGSGYISKYIGPKPFFISALVIDFALQSTLMFIMPRPDRTWILYVVSGFWGYTHGIWGAHVPAVYGAVFPKNSEAAFSCRLAAYNIGSSMAYGYSSFLCTSTKLIILTSFLVTGITCYFIMEFLRSRSVETRSPDENNTLEVKIPLNSEKE